MTLSFGRTGKTEKSFNVVLSSWRLKVKYSNLVKEEILSTSIRGFSLYPINIESILGGGLRGK